MKNLFLFSLMIVSLFASAQNTIKMNRFTQSFGDEGTIVSYVHVYSEDITPCFPAVSDNHSTNVIEFVGGNDGGLEIDGVFYNLDFIFQSELDIISANSLNFLFTVNAEGRPHAQTNELRDRLTICPPVLGEWSEWSPAWSNTVTQTFTQTSSRTHSVLGSEERTREVLVSMSRISRDLTTELVSQIDVNNDGDMLDRYAVDTYRYIGRILNGPEVGRWDDAGVIVVTEDNAPVATVSSDITLSNISVTRRVATWDRVTDVRTYSTTAAQIEFDIAGTGDGLVDVVVSGVRANGSSIRTTVQFNIVDGSAAASLGGTEVLHTLTVGSEYDRTQPITYTVTTSFDDTEETFTLNFL